MGEGVGGEGGRDGDLGDWFELWGGWGFGGMGVSEGLRREEGGIVGVEGTIGGTDGHEMGDGDKSHSPISGMEMRREGRGGLVPGVGVGRGGR